MWTWKYLFSMGEMQRRRVWKRRSLTQSSSSELRVDHLYNKQENTAFDLCITLSLPRV
jgi:hypothetical protein